MKSKLVKGKFLALLIYADLSFLILHILHVYTDLLPGSLFSLAQAGGYGEIFQYMKELWIAILFLLIGLKQGKSVYLFFSSLFLYFLFDDAFEFHEKFGAFLADLLHLQPHLGLRAVDFGELAVSVFFGALFFAAIGITHYLSDHSTRAVSICVIGMVLALALFGVLVDMAEIIFRHSGMSRILTIIEESGEMVIMSFIAWFTFRLNLSGEQIWLPFFANKEQAPDRPKY